MIYLKDYAKQLTEHIELLKILKKIRFLLRMEKILSKYNLLKINQHRICVKRSEDLKRSFCTAKFFRLRDLKGLYTIQENSKP